MRTVRWAFLAVALACAAHPAQAQDSDSERFSLVVRGVPLSRALEQLAFTTGIDLVYTSIDVSGKQSYCNGRDLSPADLLACVLKGSGLDFVRSSYGAYVLIDAVAAAPRFGHLAGSVIDIDTGEPLPYANVLLADARTGTSSDEDGLFSFASVLTGAHRVVVTYVGYEPATDSVWIDPGARHRVRIALKSAESTLAPVVVNGLTQRLPSSGLGRADQSSEQLRTASAVGTSDAMRGLANITGVAVQQPLADLHIQGSAAGEHATLLDGVPVRDPVSLGRYLSAFSPLALRRITIHKAGFGAEAGSNLAGVVDIEHDVLSGDGDRVVASIDPISINGRAEGRFRLSEGVEGAAMVAGRSSIWSTYQDPAIASLLESWHAVDPLAASVFSGEYLTDESSIISMRQPVVRFSDLHSAVRLKLSPFRTLYASAYRARNELNANFASVYSAPVYASDRLMLTRDVYDWTNWVGQIRHSWLIGSRATASTQVSGSWNYSRYAYYGLVDATDPIDSRGDLEDAANERWESVEMYPSTDEDNFLRELAWRSRFSYSVSSGHHLDGELTVQHMASRFLFENPLVMPIVHEDDSWNLTGYLAGRHSPGLGTVIEPGIRLTYLPNRETVYAEPRLAVRHDASAGRFGSVALRLAGGLYRQFVTQLDVTSSGATTLIPTSMVWLPLDGSMSPPSAYHASAEVLLMPDPFWTVSAEVYRKWQQRLLVLDYAGIANTGPTTSPLPLTSQRQFVTAAKGDVAGAGVRLQREGGRIEPTFTYSFTHARRTYRNRFDQTAQSVPWNMPHRITTDVAARLTGELRVLASWEAAWGREWPLRQAYYDYFAFQMPAYDAGSFDFSDPSTSTVPAYRRLDAGISYRTNLRVIGAEFRLFVMNVLDRRNVYDMSLLQRSDGAASISRTLPGRHLFFSVRLDY